MPDGDLLSRLNAVHDGMLNNPAYPNPPVDLAGFKLFGRLLQELRPNSRTDNAITHSAAGVLSTVIAFDASEEPKKNAFQLTEPACAAAE